MKQENYSDVDLEKFLQAHFRIDFKIDKVIARNFSVGRNADAFIFTSNKKRVYIFISADAKMLLGDMQKLLRKMGVKADKFLPPNGDKSYFNDRARTKFLEVFPGRTHISGDDLRFYKTLVPYNPGLIEVSEIKNGEIKAFDPDTKGNWRVGKKFSYKKIITK